MRIGRSLTVGALLLAASGTVWARDFRLPPGKWWENPTVVERIKLSDEQQAAIRDKVFDHALRMVDLKAQVERRELELADRVERSSFDPGQVRSAFQALQTARQRLETEHFELVIAIRQLLSPEQWQGLLNLHDEVRAQRPDRPREDLPPGEDPLGPPGIPGGHRPQSGPRR